jgi:hypothetical protein
MLQRGNLISASAKAGIFRRSSISVLPGPIWIHLQRK